MADSQTEELSLKLTTAIFEIIRGSSPTRATVALAMAVVAVVSGITLEKDHRRDSIGLVAKLMIDVAGAMEHAPVIQEH